MANRWVRGFGLLRDMHGVWFIHNGLGDVVALMNQAGQVLRRYRYSAFGVEFDQDQADTNPWRYRGEYFDTETGMIYLRARFMNPRTGRFITADPHWGVHNMQNCVLSMLQAGNLFLYTLNNPLKWIDPSGLVIQLTGSHAERNTMLNYLQQLTNHILYFNSDGIVGISQWAAQSRYEAFDEFGQRWRGYGNILIERMIASQHIASIGLTTGRNVIDRYLSGNSVINFNPNEVVLTYTFDQFGVASLMRMPAHIVLAHELIHADRLMRGVMLCTSLTGNISIPVARASFSPLRLFSQTRNVTHRRIMLEELATIGIGQHHTTNCITENMIRREQGLRPRASWFGN